MGAAQHLGDPFRLASRIRDDLRPHRSRLIFAHREGWTGYALGGQPGRHTTQRPDDLWIGGRCLIEAEQLSGSTGQAEASDEIADRTGIGAPKPGDGGVRIGEGDHPATRALGVGEQVDHARVEFGELVAEHHGCAVRQQRRVRRVGQQQPRPEYQLGVVDHPLGVQHVEIFTEEARGGDPFGTPGCLSGRGQIARIEAQLPRPGQDRADLAGEASGAERGPQRLRPR